MIRLTIQVVGDDGIEEKVFFKRVLDTYDDVDFSALIVDALHGARAALGLASLSLLKAFSPQVCLLLYADGERLRPVLNFSTEAILALAEAESSFDFDPYIYE